MKDLQIRRALLEANWLAITVAGVSLAALIAVMLLAPERCTRWRLWGVAQFEVSCEFREAEPDRGRELEDLHELADAYRDPS